MDNEVRTSIGTVTVSQNDTNGIEITLTASQQHPGIVAVNVINTNGDHARLIWRK